MGRVCSPAQFKSILASLISMLAVAWIVTRVPSRALISPWFLIVRSSFSGVGREVVVDAVDEDRRRDLGFELVLRRRGVARRDAIERVLLKTAAVRRHFAAIVVRVVDAGHDEAIVDHLAVGRAEPQDHLFAVAETADLRGDLLVVVGKHDRIARADLFNVDPRGRRHARPRPEHAPRRDQGVLRREGQVEREDRDHARQHTGQVYDAAAIDGMFDRHLQQIGRGPVFHRAIHHRRDILRVRAQQEEVDQAILERRAALLDRLRGKDRIDAIGQRRHQEPPDVGPRRRRPKRQTVPVGQ